MNISKVYFRLGLFALGSVVAFAALAHEPRPGPNGGWKVDVDVGRAELVVNDTPKVGVYLSDGSDQPVSAEGWTANAILIVDGAGQRFDLVPDANGQLAGVASSAVPKDVKGALQLVAPDGTTARAKY